MDKDPHEEQIGGDHYKTMAIQPSTFIYANGLNWYEGNAVKYICRHKVKGGKVDIEKAIHYLRLLLKEEYEPSDENERLEIYRRVSGGIRDDL